MHYAIETHGLSKFFETSNRNRGNHHSEKKETKHSKIVALDRLDLQVRQGEVFSLLGPNGAGKTTLLNILSTLLLPDEGTAEVNGHDILNEEKEVRRSISGTVNVAGIVASGDSGPLEQLKILGMLYGQEEKETDERIRHPLPLRKSK